ncbi:GTP cyclohydrolase II [Candidatus Woesearchaeota archaeon]|nr:GTP cyclohydrolase II [Candidatus Woesearchaeota archaeon]
MHGGRDEPQGCKHKTVGSGYCDGGILLNIQKGDETRLPTELGEFIAIPYLDSLNERCHVALVLGRLDDNSFVRIHSECLTGDALFSLRCDCGNQIEKAMRTIKEQGSGVIIYLRQEGRGIGLWNKLKAYALQDKGLDTVEANHQLGFRADERSYEVAVHILKDLGLKKIRLLTNNPDKIKGLNGSIEVTERIPLRVPENEHNHKYMQTKKDRMGHEV